MKVTDLPRAVLRFQYRMARMPWRFVERRVIRNWNEEAPARLMYERSVGAVDVAVGKVLGDTDLEARGDADVKRSQNLSAASRLDDAADKWEQEADDQLRAKRDKAAAAPEQAHAKGMERAGRARDVAEKRKQEADATARQRTDAVKERIDEAAENKIDEVEERRQRQIQSTAATQKSATAVAKAKSDDAAKKRIDAVSKQAHAEKLAGLADAEKRTRP
jgi:hypothetical protein